MSKDVLLQFARGCEIERKHICCFEVDVATEKISIISYAVVPGLERSIRIRVCNERHDLTTVVLDEELNSAIAEYCKEM